VILNISEIEFSQFELRNEKSFDGAETFRNRRRHGWQEDERALLHDIWDILTLRQVLVGHLVEVDMDRNKWVDKRRVVVVVVVVGVENQRDLSESFGRKYAL